MAKQRYINTNYWVDNYINGCDPTEKLLFIYLITNPSTTISGIYQCPLSTIAAQTGIDTEMIKKIFQRFSESKKAYYIDGWVIVCNFPKYQKYEERKKIKAGIDASLKEVPQAIKDAIDTLSIPYAYDIHTIGNYSECDSDSDCESESNSESDALAGDEQPNQLHHDVRVIFEQGSKSLSGSPYYHNAREAKSIADIIKIALFETRNENDEDHAAARRVIEAKARWLYEKVKLPVNAFWRDQAFLPSVLLSQWNKLQAPRPIVKASATGESDAEKARRLYGN